MSGPLYGNGRRDEAEPGVIKAFRDGGATVAQVSGRDLPDLVVGFLRETHLVEVKTNRAQLREGQAAFARAWLGSPVVVARTPAQARKWLAIWRDRAERIVFPEGGGKWAALEEHVDGLPETTAGKDPEAPA